MPTRSGPTEAILRAHSNVTKAFERAKASLAPVPLMHEQVDPRTAKRRHETALNPDMELGLNRILLEMRNGTQASMPGLSYQEESAGLGDSDTTGN